MPGWPADLKQRESDAEKAAMAGLPASGGNKIVVIDPGHGGIDSGTNGVNGLMERIWCWPRAAPVPDIKGARL